MVCSVGVCCKQGLYKDLFKRMYTYIKMYIHYFSLWRPFKVEDIII